MKLVAGIGNPGKEYKDTRHNIGFKVIDNIASKLQVTSWFSKFNGLVAQTQVENEKILLVKPLTYVNLAGRCLKPFIKNYQLSLTSILLIVDDFHLPMGTIRYRKKGSSGGHNGLQSIIESLNTKEFSRLRIGIGNTLSKDKASYVLSKFTPAEQELLDQVIPEAVNETISWITGNNNN